MKVRLSTVVQSDAENGINGAMARVSKHTRTVYLGLGSNVGSRMQNLQKALKHLEDAVGSIVTAVSPVYETEPVGDIVDQRDFLNLVATLEVALDPIDLLQLCKQIERDLGRVATAHHGPRTVDVDILLLGDLVGTFRDVESAAEQSTVTLPHPSILQRRFVLQPLLDLDSGLRLPTGESLSDALSKLGKSQKVVKVGMLGT